jgi:hypothetical protein
MRVFLTTVLAGLLLLGAGPSAANTACTREDLAKAVNDAGAALRKLNAENTPRLQDKMRQLKTKMRWPDAGYEEQAFKALQDERVAAIDAGANDLLARIDRLGTVDAKAEPDCSRLQELQAASIELQATVKAKSSYLLSKIDQMLAGAPGAAPKTAAALANTPPPEQKPAVKQTPPKTPEPVAPKATAKAPEGSAWSAETKPRPAPSQDTAALSQPLPPLESVDEGTLYLRSGGTQPIYWHGPSLGTDVGADGSKTLFLIYRLRNAEQLYDSFTGVDGSAYLVGGVGATLITNGNVVMAPIRSGLGLRLGANIGYIRFTPKPTWNPF